MIWPYNVTESYKGPFCFLIFYIFFHCFFIYYIFFIVPVCLSYIYVPAHEILVLITLSSNKSSGVHKCIDLPEPSLMHNVWKKGKAQAKI